MPGGLEEQSIGVGLEEGWKMVWAGPLAIVYPTHPRFGAGHTLTLRVPLSRSKLAADFVAQAFPGAELREAHGGRLRFQLLPGGRCTLALVFGLLAAHGAEHGVEDFSVSQTTLEEVTAMPERGWG